jgi:hypothetical protein
MKIATGASEDHPTPLAVNPSASPGVAPVTPRSGDTPGGSQTAPGRDLTAERLSQLAASEAECAASMSYGMSADGTRRQHYAAAMGPHGSSAGDALPLPVVDDNALPAAGSYAYPWSGMEPVPTAAGFDYDAGLPG